MGRFLSEAINALGMRMDDRGAHRTANAVYAIAYALDPHWTAPAFNLGLSHKRRRNWRASLRWNLRAGKSAGRGHACWWNLGIAATALREWDIARLAWKRYGIDLGETEGPIEVNFGMTPIRLDPGGSGEVVWSHRIDPTRARIASVPLPASGRRFGDIVLHDGEPRGTRMLGERECPVFDEIELFEGCGLPTHELLIEGVPRDQIRTLEELFLEEKLGAENWTESIYSICKACSEGRAHANGEQHQGRELPPMGPWSIGVGAPTEQRDALLKRWLATNGAAEVLSVKCLLA